MSGNENKYEKMNKKLNDAISSEQKIIDNAMKNLTEKYGYSFEKYNVITVFDEKVNGFLKVLLENTNNTTDKITLYIKDDYVLVDKY